MQSIPAYFGILLALAGFSAAANILAVFPHIGKSHYFMFQPFVHKLAERGHKVTVITHFPDENPPPNINFVNIRNESDKLFFNSFSLELIEYLGNFRALGSIVNLQFMGIESCEKGLSHPNFQKFLKQKNNFDLAIVEFFNTDCFASLANVYKVPLVGIFSSAMMPWHNDRFGNPDNPAYINNHFLQYPSKMNFLQRTVTTVTTVFTKTIHRLFSDFSDDVLVAKYVGNNIPPVREIVSNSSLYLINSHFTLFQPRPLVPGIIELGGFHVTPAKGKIPAEILKFIDESPNGVVLFCLGSTVRSSTMPKQKLEIFKKIFSELPQRVIWKWEEEMPDKPDNVLISKWIPQNDILAHPNIKVFITHSGLMGTEEAVYHGVPMLMLPLFGDQPLNAASCEEKGVGITIDYFNLNEEQLRQSLNLLLNDNRYAQNAKHLAKMFVDRPISIMDTAIYWTEYVIRYNGAPQLRTAVMELAWYQEALLDVYAFLFVVAFTMLYLTKKLLCSLCGLCCKPKEAQGKRKRE